MEQRTDSADNGLARSTLRAYRADWADFVAWCRKNGVPSMPASPETVARYLDESAETYKLSTLQRRMVSITHAHRAAGLRTPVPQQEVREVWDRIARPNRPIPVPQNDEDSWARRVAQLKGASDLMFH